MKLHVVRHAMSWNQRAIPFIFVTTDLLRAFNLAGRRMCANKGNVTIILIDPWKLPSGTHVDCNVLRRSCSLPEESKYETEILIWVEAPANAISARWTWSDLTRSGIFEALPSLNKSNAERKLGDLKADLVRNRHHFLVTKVLSALHSLGMDPSSFSVKQTFEFLLGQAAGYRVPRLLQTIEETLFPQYRAELKDFDRYAHNLAVAIGKEDLISYYQKEYPFDIKRLQPPYDL